MLNDICKGKAKEGVLELLERTCSTVANCSLCALGGSAPNPVLSTLRYFRDEYEAHVRDKKCPAGLCKELITYYIDPEKCNGCMLCARECPQNAIEGEKKKPHKIDTDLCIKCGICRDVCNRDAVIVK
jgi:Pyruvate/2-oxoacid:ferredoxin oxidoreductase delta subunit